MAFRWHHVGHDAVAVLEDATTELWLIALVAFGIGDVVTTMVGLSAGHLAEVGPFVAPVIDEYGVAALVVLKTAAFGIAGMLWWYTPRPHAVGVPLGLASLGVLVTGWNAYLLLIVG